MLTKSLLLKHYKRRDIQEAMIKHAENKEIGMRYGDGFGKRPDILHYPQDILELALKGITSFHASEEVWENPLQISSALSKTELAEQRIGWDLVLDIDCAVFEYSRICAHLVIQFLNYCGVEAISCKFSGNKGFHIGVPFEAFPKQVNNTLTKELFPDAPRKIAAYVTENIKEALGNQILKYEDSDVSQIREKVNLPPEDLLRYEEDSMGNNVAKLRVDKFLEIDTILISSRHLYRMPYSFHEKSALVSVPLDPNKVLLFEKHMAKPESILTTMFPFLDRDVTESARRLLLQALDFEVKIEEERELPKKQYEEIEITSPITEEFFPDCIKSLLKPLEDGKKRALFILMNFLGKLGWNKDDIKTFIYEWNSKNPEPLREVYLRGQLSSFKPGAKLPPNCATEGYYQALGIACDKSHCQRLKNPVNYSLSRWRRHLRDIEEGRIEKKEDSQPTK
jgi:hypothetical protein